ncbi:hypothetical protein DFH08DRAFT_465413 [Mycena albidolilacea]|uniref:Uncharacterized protein n=1 Tax=Mycena albidolilacea TaxID=1033008 RepID=A0AAD7EZS7_9AGAR|nr:hypothetical protein DFH08DRAFT_465413 [Mycena albidolilacea]
MLCWHFQFRKSTFRMMLHVKSCERGFILKFFPRPDLFPVLSPSMYHPSTRSPSSDFTDQSGGGIGHQGAFFPHAHNFVLNGGHFQSFTNINQPTTNATDFENFRRIAMGDIVLQECRAVIKPPTGYGRSSVRRVYSACVEDRTSSMTVSIYEGDDAEKVRCLACCLI